MRNYGREVLTERYQVQNLNRKKIILFIDSAERINIFDIRKNKDKEISLCFFANKFFFKLNKVLS